MRYLDDLVTERTALADTRAAITDAAASEMRDLSDSERATAEDLDRRIAIIDSRISEFVAQDEARAKFEGLINRARTRPETTQHNEPQGFGEMFARAAEITGYTGHGTSGRVSVPAEYAARALIQSDSFGGPSRTIVGGVPVTHSTPLLDLLGSVTVNTMGIEYWQSEGAAPLAGVVPEGATKPEAEITYARKVDVLDTIAHWVPISRQFATFEPALRSYVEGELRTGVLDKMEAEAAKALTDAPLPGPQTGPSLSAAIRRAMGAVTAAGGAPRAVLLNPIDYADLEIAAFDSNSGKSPTWGLTVVTAGSVAQGSGYVLDPRGATRFIGQSVSLFMTDSHADNFIKNVLVLLAEATAKTVVQRPEFIVPIGVEGTAAGRKTAAK
jgi:hypothetical protein